MRRFAYIIIFAALLFPVSCLFAAEESAKEIFENANTIYEKGEYDSAITEYEKLLDLGFESGNVYYNIGNAYFKKGNLGQAILNYERAIRLIPRDSDLRSNYDYALSMTESGSIKIQKKWFARTLGMVFGGFTVNGLTVFLSVLFVTGVLLLVLNIYVARTKRLAISILVLLIIVFTLGAVSLQSKIAGIGADSIILEKIADAKFAPFDEATTFFQLNEGDKVRIIDSKNGWSKIKRPDGKVGWVTTSSLEVI